MEEFRMVVSRPQSTADAISGDDMGSDMSLESGIEGSIKLCKSLLSMLPLTMGKSFDPDALQETTNTKLRKARAYLNMNMKTLTEGLEPEWNKNMGLLSNISMSRDISSSPASSRQSYSLYNAMSTQNKNADEIEVAGTRSKTSEGDEHTYYLRRNNNSRIDAEILSSTFQEGWPEDDNSARGTSGSSLCEEECQSSNPSEDVSNRASSDTAESAGSASVKNSSPKEVNLEKKSTASLKSKIEKPCKPDAIIRDNTSPSPSPIKPREGTRSEAGSKCSTPFVERLGDIQERINTTKRTKKIREKGERDLCSFRPNISSTKHFDMEGYEPIEKRLDCIREQKDKMINKARDQETRDLGITFRPELNKNSVRILKERTKSPHTLDIADESGSTSPRNSSNGCADLSDPRAKASDLSRSASVCTFVPEINPNTHLILAGTELEGCDFLTRQQQFLSKIEQRKRLKQQELPSEFTFRPERGNANFILSCSPLFRIDETISDMCERLSKSDNQRRLYIQQKITDNYYSKFAFHPHIDETSRLLGRPPSIETLYSDQTAKQHKDLMRLLAQKEFKRIYTFRPMVRIPTFPIEDAVLEERQKTKLERKKQEDRNRITRELKELAECTFKPAINPWPPKDLDLNEHQIKGVERHLELQRLAKQMKIDQAEWEKKVFFTNQNNERPKQQYTVPKPFNFHTGSCSNRCSGSPANTRNQLVPSTPLHPHLCT